MKLKGEMEALIARKTEEEPENERERAMKGMKAAQTDTEKELEQFEAQERMEKHRAEEKLSL